MRLLFTRTILATSGALLSFIGGSLLFTPKTFLEMSHVFIVNDPSLISEITAPSVLLLISGLVMIISAVKIRLVNMALLVGSIVYGSYGLGRLVSLVMHGAPSGSLIAAMFIELVIAGLFVLLRLVHFKKTSKHQAADCCCEATI